MLKRKILSKANCDAYRMKVVVVEDLNNLIGGSQFKYEAVEAIRRMVAK